MPHFARLCHLARFSVKWSFSSLVNWHKLEHFDAVLEVEDADKSIIYLPRQDLMPKQKMAEISHL